MKAFDLQLFASGAGLNRVGEEGGITLLSLQTTATALASPTTGYGTIGVNDSGIQMLEAIGLTKWVFLLGGATNLSGWSVTIYGTIDSVAYQAWQPANYSAAGLYGQSTGGPRGSTVVSAGSWFVLPGPSEQGTTGSIGNPLTSTTPILTSSLPLVAVRAVLTTLTGTPASACTVQGFAVP
jgi:hypothetical protein